MINVRDQVGKIILLIILSALLTGCGKIHSREPVYSVDPEVQPFLDSFIELAHAHGRSLPLKNLVIALAPEGSLDGLVLGVCTRSQGMKVIELDAVSWSQMSYWERRELFFHEATHCLLGFRGHIDTVENGVPLSIMHQFHQGQAVYNEKTASHFDSQLMGL